MVTTVKQAFEKLKGNLEITDLQSQTVSGRQKAVREAIESEMTVLDSFLTGSYSRSTLIAPLSQADIDILIVLDADYYEANGQAALLDRVKRVLKKTYPKTPDISRSGQAVTIIFSDFVVDVVPGFYRKGGGYLIPNSQNGTWISTDPKKHVEISTAANTAHSGYLVPLAKMIKCWNRTINKYFRSFHLEVLLWDIFDGVTISNFSSGARYFFQHGKDRVAKKNPDPAGYSGDVGYYIIGDKVQEAVSRFTTAYERAVRAEEYQRQEKVEEAFDEWRKIFDSFPAYG